jgi:hypothetical protein
MAMAVADAAEVLASDAQGAGGVSNSADMIWLYGGCLLPYFFLHVTCHGLNNIGFDQNLARTILSYF